MKSTNKDFKTLLYKDIMPKVYGIGAAVVIFGAMFKLLNWPGSALMLGLGLSTEAIIFIFSAFEPEHKEPEWERVYPELADDYNGESVGRSRGTNLGFGQILETLKLDPEVIENLSNNLTALSESVKKLSVISNASVATEEYLLNITKAANTLKEMNQLYSSTLSASDVASEMVNNAAYYNKSLVAATQNITALGDVYSNELQHASVRNNNAAKLYDEVYKAVEDLKDSGSEIHDFKIKLKKLKDSISSLSEIYENMLASIRQ
jgi:gliding motility-associated protein GldL